MSKGFFLKQVCCAAILLCVLFTGCAISDGPVDPAPEDKIDRLIAGMSTAEKVGQLLMIGIRGKAVDESSLFMLHQYHIGGVVLFDRNLETAEQVAKLTAGLQHRSEQAVPLFIAIDEEGGMVARMRHIVTPPPGAAEIGESGEPEQAFRWAERTAMVLKKLGINQNFAPVADLGSLEGRHYSADVGKVTEFVRAAAGGYEKVGLGFSLKHFPGLGKGKTDTHLDTVTITASKEQLLKEDIVPFAALIKEKPAEKFMIMVSHATYPLLDGETPASLSPAIITGLLREKLGWQGVVVTDDMEMGAVTEKYPFRELGVRAVLAGADLVLVCQEYSSEQEVYLGLLEAVEKGVISKKRLDESVRRVLRHKLSCCH